MAAPIWLGLTFLLVSFVFLGGLVWTVYRWDRPGEDAGESGRLIEDFEARRARGLRRHH